MGFPRVNDYVAGKQDWGSYGLPHEGTNVPDPLAGDVAHREVAAAAKYYGASVANELPRVEAAFDVRLARTLDAPKLAPDGARNAET